MQHALFELLTGSYQNGRGISTDVSVKDITYSIMDHLGRLLNARQNSISHMSDYGLPDITLMYQGLPYSQSDLSTSIKKLILKYETRLDEVVVENKSKNSGECILQLEVTGRLINGEIVFFDTYFMSGGYANVQYRDKGI